MRKRDVSQNWPAPLSGAEQIQICRRLSELRPRITAVQRETEAWGQDTPLLGYLARTAYLDARAEYQRLRNRLWETTMRLVVRWATRFAGPAISQDELVEIGTLRVQYAIDRFDPERGIQFSTYVSVALKREFGRAVQKAAKRRAKERQLGVVGENVDAWETLVGSSGAADYDQAPYEVRDIARVRAALAEMPMREADVVLARCRGEKQPTIAARHSVSKERARQLEQAALRRVAEWVGVDSVAGSLARL